MEFLLAIGIFVVLLTRLLAPPRRDSTGAGSPEAVCVEDSGPADSRGLLIGTGVCIAIGWFLRLYGIDRSLWLDEFGTLWAIDGDFTSVLERVFGFHGQGPLYYVALREWVALFGESEAALRVPSLLCSAAMASLVFYAGKEWRGWRTGLVAAALVWLSPPVVEAAASARPYSLALLGESMAIYGFARAAGRGDLAGRGLLVAGCAILFCAHYVLLLPALGLALTYLLAPALRRAYTPRAFSLDSVALLLLCMPALPHLAALHARGGSLSWLGPPDYYVIFETAGALLVLAVAGFVAGENRESAGVRRSFAPALWLAVVAPAGVLGLLALAGSNLLDTRYLVAVIPPAALLASDGILRIRGKAAFVPLGYALSLTAMFFAMHYLISGTFSRVGRQDWRGAINLIAARTANSGPPLILFRSGFVEAEGVLGGIEDPVLSAPLRSPGKQAPNWQIAPLNYRWDSPERSRYFETAVAPTVYSADEFFILLCDNCYNQTTGNYPNGIRDWVRGQFPGEFSERKLPGGQGILLFEYRRISHPETNGRILHRPAPDRTRPDPAHRPAWR